MIDHLYRKQGWCEIVDHHHHHLILNFTIITFKPRCRHTPERQQVVSHSVDSYMDTPCKIQSIQPCHDDYWDFFKDKKFIVYCYYYYYINIVSIDCESTNNCYLDKQQKFHSILDFNYSINSYSITDEWDYFDVFTIK